uniref:Uncharacterized protein n=1 Tax=uncultured marine virus TaxID=186617 RepID=A0A0F7L6L5_9VIRU|nr:hypothetical protein [uncultured marine virus]
MLRAEPVNPCQRALDLSCGQRVVHHRRASLLSASPTALRADALAIIWGIVIEVTSWTYACAASGGPSSAGPNAAARRLPTSFADHADFGRCGGRDC